MSHQLRCGLCEGVALLNNYFPHFLDAEYATQMGPDRAAKLANWHLKMLALLGGRITIGPTMLADSEGVQRVVADRAFRSFVKTCDSRFLRLEVERDPSATDHESIARYPWRRMQQSDWISSSSIGTEAMRRAAEVALSTGFDDQDELERFRAEITRIVQLYVPGHKRSKDRASRVLLSTFDLFSWFALDKGAVAETKTASRSTYYDKLIEALEAQGMPEREYQALSRVKAYVDKHLENKSERSAVLEVLRRDQALERQIRGEVRATVGSAWTAALADGSRAAVGLTIPLQQGVLIPRLLDPDAQAIVSREQAAGLLDISPSILSRMALRLDPDRLGWEQVAQIARATERTRSLITDHIDQGEKMGSWVVEEHVRSVEEAVRRSFPAAFTKEDITLYLIGLAGAMSGQNSFAKAAVAVVGKQLSDKVLRWTRGRFIAGTINRLARQLGSW